MSVEELGVTEAQEAGYSGDVTGEIRINEEVVAFVATLALVQEDGVITLSGRSSFSDYDGAKSRDVEKGVAVKVDSNHCTIAVEFNIRYGTNVYETAKRVQRNIRNAIEHNIGMSVDKVDVTIRGMIYDTTLVTGKK